MDFEWNWGEDEKKVDGVDGRTGDFRFGSWFGDEGTVQFSSWFGDEGTFLD